jgi:hypothetical protein
VSEPVGPDPLDELRRVNPIDTDQLPSASLARMSARVQEVTMDSSTPRSGRRRFVIPGAAAVLVAGITLVIVVGGTRPASTSVPGGTPNVALGSPSQGPGTAPRIALGSPSQDPGGPVVPGAASCVERYSPKAVAERSFAFEGTVTAIAGDEVTFEVDRRFTGAADDSVTLTATGMTGTAITSAGGPHLAVGERYLVAGEDHYAWACGFTQPYDAAVAAEWAAATGG